MNRARPFFYRRVRLFLELKVPVMASATGIAAHRIAAIETGQREPNSAERRIIERFLQDRLRVVIAQDGPIPAWLRTPSAALMEAIHD